ncbi:hypothetical protein EMN47_10790 [Prolixibacteraceae bacterium JC049]|nr:hypothetical protein [Prolixibacteraceae bacterium JC049]
MTFLERDSTLMNSENSYNLAEVLIIKNNFMKELFFMGGSLFMSILTILFIVTSAWIIYHFIVAYRSKEPNHKKHLRKIGIGKSLGLFTMVVGIMGQMVGLYEMFDAVEQIFRSANEIKPALVFAGIKVTMICTIYGITIYLLSLLLWFAAIFVLEKKANN